MTSSRFWSITGSASARSRRLRNEILHRLVDVDHVHLRAGIMMSRTCISETVSAPSMIDIASASSRLRE